MELASLRELLAQTDPHAITRAADEARRERHGARTTFAAIAHLDGDPHASSCPICGAGREEGHFVASPGEIPAATTELHVVCPAGGEPAGREAAWREALAWARSRGTLFGGIEPTVQLGTSSQWLEWEARGGLDLGATLWEWKRQGLAVISDGVHPERHAAHPGHADDWERFWGLAAAAGLRGNLSLLYGPAHPLEDMLVQLGRAAKLQADHGVFASVAPVIFEPARFTPGGGATHASADLRALAAARLGLPDVPGVRLYVAASDWKSAHFALACGVDDLEAPLVLRERSRSEDADSSELSLAEMGPWLAQVGYAPHLRNGAGDTVPFDGGAAANA